MYLVLSFEFWQKKKKKAGQKLEIALQRRRAKGGTAHPRSHTAPCWPSPLAHGPLSPSPFEAHALTVKWRYTTSLGLAWMDDLSAQMPENTYGTDMYRVID